MYSAKSGSYLTSVCMLAFSAGGIYGGLEIIISKLSRGFTLEKISDFLKIALLKNAIWKI